MSPAATGRGPALPSPELSDRSRRVLSLLVREYIEHGEPVSSLWLASHAGLQVSSATVRNVLARLEELGLVHQPAHVGRPGAHRPRLPGVRGHAAGGETRRSAPIQPDLEAGCGRPGSVEDALSTALARAVALAQVRQLRPGAGQRPDVAAALRFRGARRAAGAGRAGVDRRAGRAQGAGTGGTRSRRRDLTQAANYLNAEFVGQPLVGHSRGHRWRACSEDRVLYDRLMARALTLASSTFDEVSPEPQLFVHGMSSLLRGRRAGGRRAAHRARCARVVGDDRGEAPAGACCSTSTSRARASRS